MKDNLLTVPEPPLPLTGCHEYQPVLSEQTVDSKGCLSLKSVGSNLAPAAQCTEWTSGSCCGCTGTGSCNFSIQIEHTFDNHCLIWDYSSCMAWVVHLYLEGSAQ